MGYEGFKEDRSVHGGHMSVSRMSSMHSEVGSLRVGRQFAGGARATLEVPSFTSIHSFNRIYAWRKYEGFPDF